MLDRSAGRHHRHRRSAARPRCGRPARRVAGVDGGRPHGPAIVVRRLAELAADERGRAGGGGRHQQSRDLVRRPGDRLRVVHRRPDLGPLARRPAEATIIAAQITATGRQPLELARADTWSYSTYNLDALSRLARLAVPPASISGTTAPRTGPVSARRSTSSPLTPPARPIGPNPSRGPDRPVPGRAAVRRRGGLSRPGLCRARLRRRRPRCRPATRPGRCCSPRCPRWRSPAEPRSSP